MASSGSIPRPDTRALCTPAQAHNPARSSLPAVNRSRLTIPATSLWQEDAGRHRCCGPSLISAWQPPGAPGHPGPTRDTEYTRPLALTCSREQRTGGSALQPLGTGWGQARPRSHRNPRWDGSMHRSSHLGFIWTCSFANEHSVSFPLRQGTGCHP